MCVTDFFGGSLLLLVDPAVYRRSMHSANCVSKLIELKVRALTIDHTGPDRGHSTWLGFDDLNQRQDL